MDCRPLDAAQLYSTAIDRARQTKRTRVAAELLRDLAVVRLAGGDVPKAAAIAQDSLALYQSMHDSKGLLAVRLVLLEARVAALDLHHVSTEALELSSAAAT